MNKIEMKREMKKMKSRIRIRYKSKSKSESESESKRILNMYRKYVQKVCLFRKKENRQQYDYNELKIVRLNEMK